MDITTQETVADLRIRQSVFPDWMEKATEGRSRVYVTHRHVPFGMYVIAIDDACPTCGDSSFTYCCDGPMTDC